MKGKLKVDANNLDTDKFQIEYVMNWIDRLAFCHLEPRKKDDAPNSWTIAADMFAHLKKVFGNPHHRKNAEANFWNLYQGQKNFFTFYAKFQQLLIELEQNNTTFISDFTFKLSPEMQTQLNTDEKWPQDLIEYAKRCFCMYQGLKDTVCTKVAMDWYCISTIANQTSVKISINTNPLTLHGMIPTQFRPCLIEDERNHFMNKNHYFNCKQKGHMIVACLSGWKSMIASSIVKLDTKSVKLASTLVLVPTLAPSTLEKAWPPPKLWCEVTNLWLCQHLLCQVTISLTMP